MSQFLSIVIPLAIAVVFALVCRSMARTRNRSENLWTVLGFFFPLISLIILLIMGNDKSKSASA
jgi:formate hydrogenlyase subunit 3/multisubunit Na+/H+ antiporter MnhD subunit